MNTEYIKCPDCENVTAYTDTCQSCGEDLTAGIYEVVDGDDLLEYAIDLLSDAVSNLDASLDPTGYETDPADNDNMYECEYWVNGLIDSKYLNVELGGWFTVDLRDDEPNIYFLLALKIEGELIGECEGLQGWYDNDSETWDITWDSY